MQFGRLKASVHWTPRFRNFCFTVLLLSTQALTVGDTQGQDQPFVHYSERDGNDSFKKPVSSPRTLQSFLRQGQFFGHTRSYSMLTNNSAGLTDYHANAVGVGIGYETGRWHGLQLGISGYAIYHLASSNLSNIDPMSNQPNRYELGLFDVTDPANRNELDRLEDLYLKYNRQKWSVKLGKQHIRSPFINPQDGRMRPTLIQGALFEYQPTPKTLLNLGAINKISPRSTVHWYDIGESMGLYGLGVNPDGSKSNFKGNMPASIILYVGLERNWQAGKLKIWDQVVTNIFESRLAQWDGKFKRGGVTVLYGLQWIGQRALKDGGNSEASKSYFAKGGRSQVFGGRFGVQGDGGWQLTLNYTRITALGRYLMPREWGRDPFYTFMPRERNEGYGDVHAANLVLSRQFKQVKGLAVDLSYGRFYLPDVKNYALNKYGFPAYQQANVDVRYAFGGFWKGLDLQFLVVIKDAIKTTYDLPKYEINKVNLSHFNLILNYHF